MAWEYSRRDFIRNAAKAALVTAVLSRSDLLLGAEHSQSNASALRRGLGLSWTNVSRLQTVRPKYFCKPNSYDEIVAIVQEAEAKSLRVRAVGAGHTSTDAAICKDVLLDMSRLRTVCHADKSPLRPEARHRHLVQMDAGANIKYFNHELDDLGLAFPTLGVIDNQTISGAIATGTHGCVRSLPGLPGLVRSVLIIAAGGKKYRLEPTNGITDPNLHSEAVTQLIQDDDTFNSSLVHVGAFGIIASYIIEVEPQYWLMEVRTVEKWSDVRKQIEDNTLYRDYPIRVGGETIWHPVYGMNIALNPHEVNGDHTCMLGRFFKLGEKPHRGLGDLTRSIGPSIAGRTILPYAKLMDDIRRHPEKLPKTLDKGLHLMHDKSYINKSYKVWYQGMEEMANMTYGSEFAFDGSGSDWLGVVDAIIAKAKELSHRKNVYMPSTLMMRYSKGSPAWLAPEHGLETTAWIGTPVPRHNRKGQDVLEAFQDVCMDHGGKAHWGKMNNRVTPDVIRRWYPKLDAWKKNMRRFNPNDTFSNAFTDRFGLTEGTAVTL